MVDKLEQNNPQKSKSKDIKKTGSQDNYLISFFLKFLFWILIINAIWLIFAKQYISFKVEIVKLLASLFYGSRAPYIHEIPIFQGLATPIIPFIALVLATLSKENFKTIFNKKRVIRIIVSLVFLFIIEILGHFLEIVAVKTNIYIPYFLATILFSVGIVLFPFLSWLFVMDGWPSGLRHGT